LPIACCELPIENYGSETDRTIAAQQAYRRAFGSQSVCVGTIIHSKKPD
jgi:hypothetical protein